MITQDLRKLLNDYYSSTDEHHQVLDTYLRTKGLIFRVSGINAPKKHSKHNDLYLNDLILQITKGSVSFLTHFFNPDIEWKVQWINNFHQVTYESVVCFNLEQIVENKWLQKSGGQECFVKLIKVTPLEIKRLYLNEKEEILNNLKNMIYQMLNRLMTSGGTGRPSDLKYIRYFLKEMGSSDDLSSIDIHNIKTIVDNLSLPFEYKDIEIWNLIQVRFRNIMYGVEVQNLYEIKSKIIKSISDWEKDKNNVRSSQLKLISRKNI